MQREETREWKRGCMRIAASRGDAFIFDALILRRGGK